MNGQVVNVRKVGSYTLDELHDIMMEYRKQYNIDLGWQMYSMWEDNPRIVITIGGVSEWLDFHAALDLENLIPKIIALHIKDTESRLGELKAMHEYVVKHFKNQLT